MEATVSIGLGEQTQHFQTLAREQVQKWSHLCRSLMDAQRQLLMSSETTPGQMEDLRTALRWCLRFSKGYHVMVSDPDYPDKWIAREIEGRLIQLNESWEMLNNPMTDAEADKILNQVFPE